MKKYVLFGIILALLGSTFALGQEKPQPFSWEFGKGKKADSLYTGKTYDEVWAATIKALIIKHKIVRSDKDSGLIGANY